MALYLRKVIRPRAQDNYRVILKGEGDEVEVGSIGIQHGSAWAWRIDNRHPDARSGDAGGRQGPQGCMRQFTTAWDRFATDEANLTEFLNAKRGRR